MSRALNVTADEASVTETCRQLGLTISAIEPLTLGGTRVVCTTADGAETLRKKMAKQLIVGRPARSPLYLARRPW